MKSLDDYALKIVKELLKLQKGEDLFINCEKECVYFAQIVKQKALEETFRPVTFVVTRKGKPEAPVSYDPEQNPLSRSLGKVMLHLKSPSQAPDPALDFLEASKNMRLMMEYSHLADPLCFGRRIAVPWCSVPCFPEGHRFWDRLFASELFTEPGIHEKHLAWARTLEALELKSLHVLGQRTDLYLELDPESRFVSRHEDLESQRSFFTDLNTGAFTINLVSSLCEGKAQVRTKLLGNLARSVLKFEGGKALARPKTRSGELFLKFFQIEEGLDKLSTLTLEENNIVLSLGSSCFESLRKIPLDESELPEGFVQTVFKADLFCPYERIEALSRDGKSLLLAQGGKLLL